MKAILVLEKMPKKCRECDLWEQRVSDYDYMRGYRGFCGATYQLEFKHEMDYIPDWCPLKKLPKYMIPLTANDAKELEKAHLDANYHAGYVMGWDACLNEITGGDTE